jgi:hypothetical protein
MLFASQSRNWNSTCAGTLSGVTNEHQAFESALGRNAHLGC